MFISVLLSPPPPPSLSLTQTHVHTHIFSLFPTHTYTNTRARLSHTHTHTHTHTTSLSLSLSLTFASSPEGWCSVLHEAVDIKEAMAASLSSLCEDSLHVTAHNTDHRASDIISSLNRQSCNSCGLHPDQTTPGPAFTCIHLADAFIQSDFQERALQSA